ncbi:MAG: NAD(P)/FAD-dependent oxidoreductase [Lachnospiraceae bacterium]|nr:NAD(P)/FAD-dependent oxidoreductase [Lachnospiraceae bacterium]
MSRYDVVIVGAGVTGCAIARELARGQRNIAVLEKNADICEGTSKANSGIVHAGYDAKEGTLKAKLNVRGNEMMEELSKKLDFPFRRNGSLVLCFNEEDLPKLEVLKDRGEKNGVKGIRILTPAEVWEMEPNITKDLAGALFAPTGGIVCPFGMTEAFAENASVNGVDFYFEKEVTSIEKTADGFKVICWNEIYETKAVINAAGVFADEIHNMVSDKKLKIVPRRGQYNLLDKKCGDFVDKTIFQLPSKLGKGILVTPTVHGNLLVGPTAEDLDDKTDTDTTAEGMSKVFKEAALSAPDINKKMVITSFSGLRAHFDESGPGDFLIEELDKAPGFFDVAGIESPGLSAAPAIGQYVAEMVNRRFPVPDRIGFVESRKGIPNMANASDEERESLIKQNPLFANVICRCEFVTEGEIVEAIDRPVGARTLDGIKRRTRAGMGRCQSGFCQPKVLEILERELNTDRGNVCKSGSGSEVLKGFTKEDSL